jgi:hypothetical protein
LLEQFKLIGDVSFEFPLEFENLSIKTTSLRLVVLLFLCEFGFDALDFLKEFVLHGVEEGFVNWKLVGLASFVRRMEIFMVFQLLSLGIFIYDDFLNLLHLYLNFNHFNYFNHFLLLLPLALEIDFPES